MKYIIYRWTNKKNGKVYVGKTAYELNQRTAVHRAIAKAGSRYKFHQALRKHGEDSFLLEVVATTESLEESKTLERKFIVEHDSYRNGYNMTPGGEGSPCTPEKALKISEAKKGKSLPHMRGNNYSSRLMWATNGTDNLRLRKEEPIPEGYKRGRINTPGPRLNGTKRPKFPDGYQTSQIS